MLCSTILADHIASTAKSGLPPETRDVALRLVLDILGAAASGSRSVAARATRAALPALFGKGRSPVWFSGGSSTVTGAVLCNAVSASALDVDDGHRAARGHPGAGVVSTALTLASSCSCSADQLLCAIVIGYDIGVRVAAAQNPEGIATRQSGRWAGLAAMATAAVLRGDPSATIAQALSIASVLAPNQQANGSSGYSSMTGNDVKEGIGWSSVIGLAALELASHGHTGPLDFLDHAGFYDRGRLLDGLSARWEITGLYFKPYACCRYIHPALDRVGEVMSAYSLAPADILSIEVETFAWASRLGNLTAPSTLVDIQYSLPYCLAVRIIDGRSALLPIRETSLARPDLTDLARRVRLVTRRDIDGLFPAETMARVTIVTGRGRFSSETGGAHGDQRQPMLWFEIEEKFRILTEGELEAQRQQALIDAVMALAENEIGPLLSEIGHAAELCSRDCCGRC